jgi:hypothetical protein
LDYRLDTGDAELFLRFSLSAKAKANTGLTSCHCMRRAIPEHRSAVVEDKYMNRRLRMLRAYRAVLANEVRARAAHYVQSSGCGPDNCPQLMAYIKLRQDRIRLMNVEVDKLMAIELGRKDAQCAVPQELLTA